MHKIDMSAKAVTTRLKRVSQLRKLGLSLQRAKIKVDAKTTKSHKLVSERFSQADKQKNR